MQKHLPLFQVLEMSDRKQRKAIINVLDNAQINVLCEIVYNFLHGALPVSKTALDSFRSYKEQFRQIVNKMLHLKRKESVWLKYQNSWELYWNS